MVPVNPTSPMFNLLQAETCAVKASQEDVKAEAVMARQQCIA